MQYIIYGFFILWGYLGGVLVSWFTWKRIIHRKLDEAIDFIPPPRYNKDKSKVIFAEPVTPEEVFKSSKSLDEFITKV